jgi:hypothetical protein
MRWPQILVRDSEESMTAEGDGYDVGILREHKAGRGAV